MKVNLQPGVVAISGGAGDIGLAMAALFLEAGCRVALADKVESRPDVPAEVFYQPLDVTDAEGVDAWYEAVVRHFGEAPRYIVPNAATVTLRRFLDLSAPEWKRELDVNLNGAFYFAHTGAQQLARAGRDGRIVFIGSWAAHAPHRDLPAYSVAKAGLRMLMQTLALELAALPAPILVNEVAPGYVDAGLSGEVFARHPNLREEARAAVPLRRLLSARDVAMQVLLLCSEAGQHSTGSTLLMDGGLSLIRGKAGGI